MIEHLIIFLIITGLMTVQFLISKSYIHAAKMTEAVQSARTLVPEMVAEYALTGDFSLSEQFEHGDSLETQFINNVTHTDAGEIIIETRHSSGGPTISRITSQINTIIASDAIRFHHVDCAETFTPYTSAINPLISRTYCRHNDSATQPARP